MLISLLHKAVCSPMMFFIYILHMYISLNGLIFMTNESQGNCTLNCTLYANLIQYNSHFNAVE